jgi:hypothetical protein
MYECGQMHQAMGMWEALARSVGSDLNQVSQAVRSGETSCLHETTSNLLFTGLLTGWQWMRTACSTLSTWRRLSRLQLICVDCA